jgi:hypothetical protein
MPNLAVPDAAVACRPKNRLKDDRSAQFGRQRSAHAQASLENASHVKVVIDAKFKCSETTIVRNHSALAPAAHANWY